jgi:excinuclease ABC subunit B
VASFKVESPLIPQGDQPAAIKSLVDGFNNGMKFQTLVGITGSGKSATIAWTIEKLGLPTLILAHNKSLAAQLASEMKEFFPNNAVEFFISYYDYYQPEAYVASKDLYIEKDSSINDEIDRLRHSATSALLTRSDVIVVASVSAIYGLGSPTEYKNNLIHLRCGQNIDIADITSKLVDMRYERNDFDVTRGTFRKKGDVLDIHAAYDDTAVRLSFFGDEIEAIGRIDLVTGELRSTLNEVTVFPATHYTTTADNMDRAMKDIESELDARLEEFEASNRLLEAQRLRLRTKNDLDMISQIGYCSGIENYSMHIDGRKPGDTPYCLLDYFPDDYLVVVDESHVSVPQIHGQYASDRSRKDSLVEFGFRLPSAYDNRPLKFDEFINKVNKVIFLSATPAKYEVEVSENVVEQIIRPTGLLDPIVTILPSKNQIDKIIEEIHKTVALDERILITTLTKKMAEDLTDYLADKNIKVKYMHSDVSTIDRIEIIRQLRLGVFDVLVGINLLREGLDLPEVSLVAILDADKEGFLRSTTSLIQTIGRAARNSNGRVILFADNITKSIKEAVGETKRRRKIQEKFNKDHSITATTIKKEISNFLEELQPRLETQTRSNSKNRSKKEKVSSDQSLTQDILADLKSFDSAANLSDEDGAIISHLEDKMKQAAKDLQFEVAAQLRDEIVRLKREQRFLKEVDQRNKFDKT